MLLADFTDYFDRAPRGAALETLQRFGVRSGTPFSSYLRAFCVVVASTVEKGGPLAPSAEMAIELVHIRTVQQYPMLMPTLFPGELATRPRLQILNTIQRQQLMAMNPLLPHRPRALKPLHIKPLRVSLGSKCAARDAP